MGRDWKQEQYTVSVPHVQIAVWRRQCKPCTSLHWTREASQLSLTM